MSNKKTNLINSILWDKHFGVDLISTTKNQNFDIKTLKKIITPAKKTKKVNEPKIPNINIQHLNNLEDIYLEIDKIEGCQNLKTPNNKAVYCDGVQNAQIVLIGEAPGEEESLQGIPFCGQSGQLLDKVLETVNISRKNNLYITNSVFWRPPANRKPTDVEIETCRPFVERQIEIIQPRVVILCGSTACHSVLQTKESIGNLRQNEIELVTKNGFKTSCIAIYHPAFLLRNPISKKSMWFDMLFLQKILFAKLGK